MQSTGRWLNQSQPQTLFIATWLLYANAAFALLDVLVRPRILTLGLVWILYFAIRIGGGIMGGRGIANEQRVGYFLGIAAAVAPFLLRLYLVGNPLAGSIITLAFEVALVALLVHPMSREYQKVWFK